MGNTPKASSSSSLIVEQSRNNSYLKSSGNSQSQYQRSHSNNPYRNHNQAHPKNPSFDPKLKVVSNNKVKASQLNVQRHKAKNPIYFSVKKLSNQPQKYKTKEKIKIHKDKSRCSTAEKPHTYNSIGSNQKKPSRMQPLLINSSKLFQKPTRQPFLSPGGSASKRKAITIKETSLNKSPKNIKNERKYYTNLNINPKPLTLNQMEIRRSYDLEWNEQADKQQVLKSTKKKQKINTAHELYFQKSRSKLCANVQKVKTQNQNHGCYGSSLYIPNESHKNPMGKQKLAIGEKKKNQGKNPQNANFLGNSELSSLKQFLSQPAKADANEPNISPSKQMIREKEYSICDGSACNLSKISMKQIQSEIRIQQSQVSPTSINFVFDESIIIRGANEQ